MKLHSGLKTGDQFTDGLGRTVTVIDRTNFNGTTNKTCRLRLQREIDGEETETWTVDL